MNTISSGWIALCCILASVCWVGGVVIVGTDRKTLGTIAIIIGFAIAAVPFIALAK